MSTTMLPPGLVTGRPAPIGSHHRLLHQVNFGGLGAVGRVRHSPLFHLCDFGRDADDDTWMHEFLRWCAFWMK